MKFFQCLALCLLFSLPLAAQHQHTQHLQLLVDEYISMKNALAEDDFDSAKKHLAAFSEEVKNNDEMNHHEEHAKMHEMHHGAMVNAVNAALAAPAIDSLRTLFKNISAELQTAVQNQGHKTTLYVQYCPMKDATWLSETEEIRNPYYGAAMLTCGRIEKILEAKHD